MEVDGQNVEVAESVWPRLLSVPFAAPSLLDFDGVNLPCRTFQRATRTGCIFLRLAPFLALQFHLNPDLSLSALHQEVVRLVADDLYRPPALTLKGRQKPFLENRLGKNPADSTKREVR